MSSFDPNALVLALENAIMQHLREDADDGFHTYTIGEYYPHAIGYCPLRYYYIYKYARDAPLPDRAVNMTSAGRIAHDLVQSALDRLGYVKEKQFVLSVSEGVRIVGRVDAYWPGGPFRSGDPLASYVSQAVGTSDVPPHVIEIKSTNFLPREPYPKHKQQLNLYLYALGVDFGLFVYVSRRDFARRIFYFARDPALYNESIAWVLLLHESLVSGIPPEPMPVADWECEGCPLRGVCPYHHSQTRIDDFVPLGDGVITRSDVRI